MFVMRFFLSSILMVGLLQCCRCELEVVIVSWLFSFGALSEVVFIVVSICLLALLLCVFFCVRRRLLCQPFICLSCEFEWRQAEVFSSSFFFFFFFFFFCILGVSPLGGRSFSFRLFNLWLFPLLFLVFVVGFRRVLEIVGVVLVSV